jgi:chitin deacetylase
MKKIIIYLFLGLAIILTAGIATFQYSRSWQHAFFIDPIYKITTGEKVVALTFDDGPSKKRTPLLLDILKKNNVKATFFMLGENIEKYTTIAQAVYTQGHLIGNHSYDHPRLIFKSPSFIKDQITKTDRLIKSTGQLNVRYFRPPYSSKYIMLPLALKSLNKKLVTGTYDPPSEYISPYNAEKVAHEVIENIKPGSIIYLHDGKNTDQEQFVKSVELIITGLRNKKYRFVRVDYENQNTQ